MEVSVDKVHVLDFKFVTDLRKLLFEAVKVKIRDLNASVTVDVDPVPIYLRARRYYIVNFNCVTYNYNRIGRHKMGRLRSQSIKNRKRVADFLKDSYMLTKPFLHKKEVEYEELADTYSQSRSLSYKLTSKQLNVLYGLLKMQNGIL